MEFQACFCYNRIDRFLPFSRHGLSRIAAGQPHIFGNLSRWIPAVSGKSAGILEYMQHFFIFFTLPLVQ